MRISIQKRILPKKKRKKKRIVKKEKNANASSSGFCFGILDSLKNRVSIIYNVCCVKITTTIIKFNKEIIKPDQTIDDFIIQNFFFLN